MEGLKAKGSLPVRLCPVLGVNREGRGEWLELGGRVSEFLRMMGEEGVEPEGGPSSGMLSMDSELLEIPLLISGLGYRPAKEEQDVSNITLCLMLYVHT